MRTKRNEGGFALLFGLMLSAMLAAVLAAYFAMTNVELRTTKASIDQSQGFYAAEAGLNVRAESIRQEFLGYNRPAGSPPPEVPGELPCSGADLGSGDFRCMSLPFRDRDVRTSVGEDPSNPTAILIPPGEAFQNLNAQEYGYDIRSVAVNAKSFPEAILAMHVQSRLVPLFQFAAFYNKDLEILPGPDMTLAGPVHTNGDLYLGANSSLTVQGQVTTAGSLYHGRKNADNCMPGGVSVYDPGAPAPIPACGPGRVEVLDPQTVPWNGMIRLDVDVVTVPPPEALDPTPGAIYWDKADVRVMLALDAAGDPLGVQVRNPDGSINAAMTAYVGSDCGAGLSAVRSTADSFYNFREGTFIDMLEIDAQKLLDCMQLDPALIGGKALNDSTEGGLVWYLGVDGPASDAVNNYGVRVKNGAKLASTLAGAPPIQGLTVVTNQAVYVEGSYNSDAAWKPAAFLADSLNVLSNNWDDTKSTDSDMNQRIGTGTAIYAAFLAGTDSTGATEGPGGQDLDNYNGGLENYPRFHEKWTGNTLTYRGSFVSLNLPLHVDGTWTAQSYSPPNRDWGYETRFNDAANLPPLSPRFVYLRQDLFVRDFEY